MKAGLLPKLIYHVKKDLQYKAYEESYKNHDEMKSLESKYIHTSFYKLSNKLCSRVAFLNEKIYKRLKLYVKGLIEKNEINIHDTYMDIVLFCLDHRNLLIFIFLVFVHQHFVTLCN